MHTVRGLFVGSLLVVLVAAGARAEDWQPLWSTATLSEAGNCVGAGAGGKALFVRNTVAVDIYNTAGNTWSTTNLSTPRYSLAAAGAGTKVLFGGGVWYGIRCTTVDIYDTANSSWTAASLSQARDGMAAAVVGTKALFGGGFTGSGGSDVVDIYDAANDSWSADSRLSQARYGMAAASVGTKVLFGGGLVGLGYTDRVDIYDAANGNWTQSNLSQGRYYLAAAGAGTKVLFGGGYTYAGGVETFYNLVDIYDTVSGLWTTATLSQARSSLAAASVGTKVFFAGGNRGTYVGVSDVVDIYDTANGSWTTATLSKPRRDLAAVTVGNQVVFAGGASVANVDIYRRQYYDTITSVQNFTLVDATVVDGRMQLNGGSLGLGSCDLAVGSMSGVAAVAMGSQTLTVGGDNTSADYAGSVSSVAGLLIKTGTGTQTLSHAGIPFNLLGSVSVNQGVLVLSSGLTSAGGGVNVAAGAGLTAGGALNRAVTNNGTLTGPGGADWLTLGGEVMGTGAYAGNVKFAHEFEPGNGGPAHVDLANVAFDVANTLELNVNGTTAGSQYDQLHVAGTATLGGTLVLNLGGFTPGAGQTFALLVGMTSGRFDTLVGVPAGWGIEYAAGGVTLKQLSSVSSVAVTPLAASVPVSGTQAFTAVALDAGGNVLATQPSFAWAVTGGGTIDSAGVFTAGGAAGGPHTVTAAAGGASGTGMVWVTAAGNQAPTVATAPAANPNPVTAKTTSLSVLGADDGGEGSLSYTWAAVGSPPAAVAFSPNGSNGAKSSTATFAKAGVYTLQVRIQDAGGALTIASLAVTVSQWPSGLAVLPPNPSVTPSASQQFTASLVDQFGDPVGSSLTFAWSVSGGGLIAQDGLFTAGVTPGGPHTVTAGISATTGVTVVGGNNHLPTIVSPAWADANPVTLPAGTTVHVVASDPDGDPLTYAWSKVSGTGTVTWATPNAADSGVTFGVSGSYVLRVTVNDGQGGRVTSEVTVAVNGGVDPRADCNDDGVVNALDLQIVIANFGQTVP